MAEWRAPDRLMSDTAGSPPDPRDGTQFRCARCGSRLVYELQPELGPQKRRVPVLSQQGRVPWNRIAVEIQRFLPALGQLVAALKVLIGKKDAPSPDVQDAIESPLPRRRAVLLPEMPLARHRREISGVPQHFGGSH